MAYFSFYPTVYYGLWNNKNILPKVAVDICARAEVIPSIIIDNTSIYYYYNVKDGERPEDIAFKYYGDPQFQWILTYFNNVIDPYYDWALSYDVWLAYVANKYGSIPTAQETIYAYVKIITKVDSGSGEMTITQYTIDETTYNNTPAFTFQTINLPNGQAVQITTTTQTISAYDQEMIDNENLRTVKILDKRYQGQIAAELETIFDGP